MKIPISPRLLTCAQYVRPNDRIADIGCDHGYLSLYLLANNLASFAIAADINEMPLKSAKSNAEKFGFAEKMSFHISDGAQNIPKEFDTMICAGMGADTIVSILDSSKWLASNRYRLILQCQSKTASLRQYLSENGWYIAEEQVLRDGKFLYTVMQVSYDPERSYLEPYQYYFPPALLNNKSYELKEYYKWIVAGLRIQVQHRKDRKNTEVLSKIEALSDIIFVENTEEIK